MECSKKKSVVESFILLSLASAFSSFFFQKTRSSSLFLSLSLSISLSLFSLSLFCFFAKKNGRWSCIESIESIVRLAMPEHIIQDHLDGATVLAAAPGAGPAVGGEDQGHRTVLRTVLCAAGALRDSPAGRGKPSARGGRGRGE